MVIHVVNLAAGVGVGLGVGLAGGDAVGVGVGFAVGDGVVVGDMVGIGVGVGIEAGNVNDTLLDPLDSVPKALYALTHANHVPLARVVTVKVVALPASKVCV